MVQTKAEILRYAAQSHTHALEVVTKLLAIPTVPVTSQSSVQDIINLINGVQSPLENEMVDLPDIGDQVGSGTELDELIKKLNK